MMKRMSNNEWITRERLERLPKKEVIDRMIARNQRTETFLSVFFTIMIVSLVVGLLVMSVDHYEQLSDLEDSKNAALMDLADYICYLEGHKDAVKVSEYVDTGGDRLIQCVDGVNLYVVNDPSKYVEFT